MKKICIVTTRHISYNPRVLKEADAFFNRGYNVTVVTVNNHYKQSQFDRELMKTRKWHLKTVNFRKEVKQEKSFWIYLSLQQKLFAFLSKISLHHGFAERVALKGYNALLKLAIAEKADFYIAHHAEALGLAYKAAEKNKAGFGFDAEDFHSGMNESPQPSRLDELITYLETKYLPHCTYFTAASKGIGEAYVRKYQLKEQHTILNVFPTEYIEVKEVKDPVRFYWYSQVIGPNRSLETLMEAASQVTIPFEIHLRGSFHSQAYENELKSLIEKLGLAGKIYFHPPILAEDIIREAANYDIGLALESDISINRNICVTNKIFSYLMSGLAIIGTDTYGQKDIFSYFSDAVRLCRMNDANDLALAMTYFLQHPERIKTAKEAARKAALERFNWDVESERLIHYLENILNLRNQPEPVMLQSQ